MNIIIDAGPGSGKTTTLKQAFLYLLTNKYHFRPNQEQVNICYSIASQMKGITASQTVFLAFNTTTRDKLAAEIPANCKAYTFGGLGQSLLFKRHQYQALDKTRGEKLLAQVLGKDLAQLSYPERLKYYALLKYVSYCKEELLLPSPESFHTIYTKYTLPEPPEDIALATKLMKLMQVPNGSIEYIDQVWMGLQTIKAPLYKLAFIDEAQDLSALRLEFCMRVAEHCVFCGDPFQSINAFAGADHLAFQKIKSVAAIALPLKESFRLPPNHIEHANKVRPARITAHKLLPGPIESFPLSSLATKIRSFIDRTTQSFQVRWRYNPDIYTTNPNPDSTLPPAGAPYDPSTHTWTISLPPETDIGQHLIVGRTNAEIFQVAVRLIKEGIPCSIVRRKEDQDIKVTLSYYLQDKLKSLKNTNGLMPALLAALERDKAKAKAMPFKQGNLLFEKANCLIHLCNLADTPSQIPEVLDKVTSGAGIKACTVHKAKGMEAQFIYILFPPIPHPRAETPQDKEQEINIEFVSETRSMFYKGYVKD